VLGGQPSPLGLLLLLLRGALAALLVLVPGRQASTASLTVVFLWDPERGEA